MNRPQALVVGGNPRAWTGLLTALDAAGIDARVVADPHAAQVMSLKGPIDLVVVERQYFEDPGIGLPAGGSEVPVVVASDGAVTEEKITAWLARGAFDAVEVDAPGWRVRLIADRALTERRRRLEFARLQRLVGEASGVIPFVGSSAEASRLRERLERLGATDRPVLFWGEPGTGKEFAARLLHTRSPRGAHPFVPAMVQHGEVEVDLDGARGGSLFVDGLSGLTPRGQEQLLQVLDPGRVREADVRLLSSGTDDPGLLVEQGRFSDSLFKRLGAELVKLPALRERTEDIAVLARHIVEGIAALNRLDAAVIEPAALDALERYRWPGNVWELRNALEHAAIVSADGRITLPNLPPRVREGALAPGAADDAPELGSDLPRFRVAKRKVIDAFEHRYLGKLMRGHAGNVTSAAEHAGMLRSALQRLLRKHGLRSADYRASIGGGIERVGRAELT